MSRRRTSLWSRRQGERLAFLSLVFFWLLGHNNGCRFGDAGALGQQMGRSRFLLTNDAIAVGGAGCLPHALPLPCKAVFREQIPLEWRTAIGRCWDAIQEQQLIRL